MSLTPTSSTASVLTNSTPREGSSSSPRPSTTKVGMQQSTEEKVVNRYTGMLLAEGIQKKMEVADHMKRLAVLRKVANELEKTDWQYEPIEKLLGQ